MAWSFRKKKNESDPEEKMRSLKEEILKDKYALGSAPSYQYQSGGVVLAPTVQTKPPAPPPRVVPPKAGDSITADDILRILGRLEELEMWRNQIENERDICGHEVEQGE